MNKTARHNSTRRSITSRPTAKRRRHRVEVSSGGLVFKRTPQGIYFGMMKDSFGRWAFPKGHVRKGESLRNAARREIQEELGISDMHFIKPLGQIDIWFRDRFVFKGKLIHKYIHYFLFQAPAGTRLKKPTVKEAGERIQGVAWVPVEKILTRSSYSDMQPIIKRALASLKTGKRMVRKG